MPIYDPQLRISKAERAAIRLIDWLLRRANDENGLANSSPDLLDVSPAEARDLAKFLDEFRRSRKFVEGAYFAEVIAAGNGATDRRAKEIFLSWRTRSGKTRVASTFAWNDFLVRSGFDPGESTRYMRTLRSSVRPMDLPHFLAMEKRLAQAYGLSDQATAIITDYFNARLRLIDEVRIRKRMIPSGTVERSAGDIASTFDGIAKCSPKKSISKSQLAACAGLIMDIGAMFVTRDWTATGVASVVGTTLPDLVGIK